MTDQTPGAGLAELVQQQQEHLTAVLERLMTKGGYSDEWRTLAHEYAVLVADMEQLQAARLAALEAERDAARRETEQVTRILGAEREMWVRAGQSHAASLEAEKYRSDTFEATADRLRQALQQACIEWRSFVGDCRRSGQYDAADTAILCAEKIEAVLAGTPEGT